MVVHPRIVITVQWGVRALAALLGIVGLTMLFVLAKEVAVSGWNWDRIEVAFGVFLACSITIFLGTSFLVISRLNSHSITVLGIVMAVLVYAAMGAAIHFRLAQLRELSATLEYFGEAIPLVAAGGTYILFRLCAALLAKRAVDSTGSASDGANGGSSWASSKAEKPIGCGRIACGAVLTFIGLFVFMYGLTSSLVTGLAGLAGGILGIMIILNPFGCFTGIGPSGSEG